MTGIRGIAALWVMLYHAQQGAGTTFNLPLLAKVPDLRSGWHGVDLTLPSECVSLNRPGLGEV